MVLFGTHSPRVSSSFLSSSKQSDVSGISRQSSIVERKGLLLYGASLPKSFHSDFSGISRHSSIWEKKERRRFDAFLPRIKGLYDKNETSSEDEHLKQANTSHRYVCSFVVIYTMIFFNGCCFTAVAPSVPFYLKFLMAPPEFLGWVVSFYSLGQIFGSPIAGWLSSNLSSKSLLTLSSVLGLISSLLYAIAPRYILILFSRLLTGISAGMEFTTELVFIANHTTHEERTAYLASVTACNVAGFIMGPALGTVLAILDLRILGLIIDQNTGPGWLLAAMFLIDLIMLRTFFKEHVLEELDSANEAEDSERTWLMKNKKKQSDVFYKDDTMKGLEANPQESGNLSARGEKPEATDVGIIKEPPPPLFLVLSLIFLQFSLMCGFSLLETITAPLVQDEFGWTVRECNLLFTCGGAFSLAAYVTFVVLSKHVQDRWLVFTALVLCSAGFLIAVDWKQLNRVPRWVSLLLPPYLATFLVSFNLIYSGFMTGRSLVFALYSKLIAQQYQGKYLGWMVAGGSAARTLGPFAAVSLYYGIKGAGYNLLALFGSLGFSHLACLALVIYHWPQLLPGNPELTSLPLNNGGRSPKDHILQ